MKARIIKTGEIIEGELVNGNFAYMVNGVMIGLYTPDEHELIYEAELCTSEPLTVQP